MAFTDYIKATPGYQDTLDQLQNGLSSPTGLADLSKPVPNRIQFSQTNPLVTATPQLNLQHQGQAVGNAPVPKDANAPITPGPLQAPTPTKPKAPTPSRDALGQENRPNNLSPNDIQTKDNSFLNLQLDAAQHPVAKPPVLGANGQPLVSLGPDGKPVPVAPQSNAPDPAKVKAAQAAITFYGQYGEGEVPTGAFDTALHNGTNTIQQSKEVAPRTYSFDSANPPNFFRTVTVQDLIGHQTLVIKMPISQAVYQSELTGPPGGEGLNARPLPPSLNTSPRNTTALGDAIPAQFQGQTADAIAVQPTGPEFLAVLDAHDAFAATGVDPKSFAGMKPSDILPRLGGPEYLAWQKSLQNYNTVVSGGTVDAGGPKPPGADDAAGAPQVDRTKIDPLLQETLGLQPQMQGLVDDTTAAQAAQDQLLRNAQQAAQTGIGNARGGNRFDRAELIQQGIGNAAFTGTQASQAKSALTAQQETQHRALIGEATTAIAGLGLDAAALDINAQSLNMGSVSNYLDNLFADQEQGLKIDDAEAERITNFARDMALINVQYAQLSQTEQQAILEDMMDRYQIDEKARVALRALAQQGKWNWSQFGQDLIKAGAIGGIAAISDKRAKTDIHNTSDSDLADLMDSIKSYNFKYKDPADGKGTFMGPMAQDLQKSSEGNSMVQSQPSGKLQIDSAHAGLTALAGLAMVYKKLQDLEDRL